MKTKLIIIALLALTACKKDTISPSSIPGAICATCTESHSGYTAKDFCADPISVDTYINELKKTGSQYGQSWSCVKH
ncbi:MAG: hypothetical protein M0Q38_15455 [Bacteroidales bacterium]|jgi:hypothetical protein|nr:hypothetical protein [Bacteroidales bacterium]